MLQPNRQDRGRWLVLALGVSAAALAWHIILLPGSLTFGTPGDHDEFVRWGMQAVDQGLVTLYDRPPPRHDWRVWHRGAWHVEQHAFEQVCNYPPLSGYLLYVSGLVFEALSSDRLINTVTSHACFSSWSILCDFIVAAGCAALVGLFRPGWPARLTYLVALFFPPFWWDSVVWAQMDTVLMATVVWMVYAMLRGRWLVAGVLWGLAFAIKPQAVLLIPLWGYALVTARPRRRVVLGGLLAGLTLLVVALPFLMHSGWAWLRYSYVHNLSPEYGDETTMSAFNVWYVDVLRTDSLSASARWGPLTKSLWSKIFLLTGLVGGFGLAVWRWRHDRRGLILWAALSLLLFMMLPTAVHERYLLLVLPFLGVGAVLLPSRLMAGFVLLSIVAFAQVTWPAWKPVPAGSWPDIEKEMTYIWAVERKTPAGQRRPPFQLWVHQARLDYLQDRARTSPFEWTFTVLALVGTAATVAGCVIPLPRRPASVAVPPDLSPA